jgi:hypothetical protein
VPGRVHYTLVALGALAVLAVGHRYALIWLPGA